MAAEDTPTLLASNEIGGTEILSETGESLGVVDHLVIDPVAGKIAYAVVAFGGIMGLGQQSYAIPWGSVRFNSETGAFVTAITSQQIESAPERPHDWHRDDPWHRRTFDHFGVRPYWF